MHAPRWTRLAAALLLALCLGVAACGDSEEESAGGAAAEGAAKTVDIKVGEFSWTAAAVQTQILAAIAEAHPELGVGKVESVKLDPAAGWVGIGRGDVDVLTEVNLPNQQPFADKAGEDVKLSSKVYDGAVQAWFVPRYAVEGDGAPLAGLTSIDQLNDYKDKVGGTLYDGDAGWITTQQNEKRLKGYELDLDHAKSSEAALIAQVKRAFSKEEPILFFFYRPHWLFQQFDVVQLEEPNPYAEGCFEGNDQCAIPAQESWIAARADLAERAPKFAALLEQVQIPLRTSRRCWTRSTPSSATPPRWPRPGWTSTRPRWTRGSGDRGPVAGEDVPGRHRRRPGRQLQRRPRRAVHAHGAVRLREVDRAADAQPARRAHRRHRAPRRARTSRRSATPSCATSATGASRWSSSTSRCCRTGACATTPATGCEIRGVPRARARSRPPRALEQVGLGGLGRPPARRPLRAACASASGWPARCARRRRPADGRAVLGTRPADPPRDAGPAGGAPATRSKHHRLHHPRSQRGGTARRPHHAARRRPRRSRARRGRSSRRPPTTTWRASSPPSAG